MGMAGTVLRDTLIIGAIGLATAAAAIHKEKVYDYLGIQPPAAVETEAADAQSEATTNATLPVTKIKGVAVSIPKSKTDGQYWTNARVDNGVVNFLIDTGANSVALTPEDAVRAGIKLHELDYNIPISTAGGQNVAASVTLKSISIGPVTLRNVRAIVVPEGLTTSLLGMTFLGQLQKVEATPHALILRL